MLPKVPVVTAADKIKVSQILMASVAHYQHLLELGKAALGSTQYTSGTAGLAAFGDPNSAASRFRDYRKMSNAERDLSFLTAFKKADDYYTAANEPNSIGSWRDDMSTATSSLNEWVSIAVGWQISGQTTAELNVAEAKFNRDVSKAQADISAVVAGR